MENTGLKEHSRKKLTASQGLMGIHQGLTRVYLTLQKERGERADSIKISDNSD